MTAFGLAARWIHLACGLGLLGIVSATLLAGRSDRRTAQAWAGLILRLARSVALAVLLSGVATLAYQVATVGGEAAAVLEPAAWLRLLGDTRFGAVWLLRHGTLVLFTALVLLREREESGPDWAAWRIEAWMLAAVATAGMAWAGHAIAVEPLGPFALLADVLHLLAAGCWLGALLPLALLLRAASSEAGADARPYAVLAVRRFSVLAMAAMLLVVATGLVNAWSEVGSIPALIGTRYGRLVLAKVALLGPILAFAVVNRRRLLPALSKDARTVGRPAMARLSRFMAWELALGLSILAVTAALSLTVPGAHDDAVWWPFPYRLSSAVAAVRPETATRLLVGSQLSLVGLLAALLAWLVERRRALWAGLGVLVLLSGLFTALPPLAVDAYPTTYRRSPLPYQAGSIAAGAESYRAHCFGCHGQSGKGDGPALAASPTSAADLTGPRAAVRTAGDLFWRITHGAPGMPTFRPTLSEDQCWELVLFLRALAAGEQARALTPLVERNRRRVDAPDFSYGVGPTPPRNLQDFRGRSIVLLVLFSLPESRRRVDQLAAAYSEISFSGAEIVAVPIDANRSIIGRLGATPPILFPVVTEGAAEITRAYALFSRTRESPAPRHAEFLIDRQGYIRARWIPGAGGNGWDDVRTLTAEISALSREEPFTRGSDEHAH